jgi:hypothetical protein
MTNYFVTNRDKVLARLRDNESTTIEFMKVDGSHRTMQATLNEAVLLEKEGVKSVEAREYVDTPNAPASDLIAVYDLEAEGFRSFYIQNLIYVEGIDPEA